MHFRVTSDANADSGVGEVVDEISGPLRLSFVHKDYGSGLLGIVVVLMCRDPTLNFERRLRLARNEKKLYMDIMLDIEQMRRASHKNRKAIIAGRLLREIPEVMQQFAIKSFDQPRFIGDVEGWFRENRIDTFSYEAEMPSVIPSSSTP